MDAWMDHAYPRSGTRTPAIPRRLVCPPEGAYHPVVPRLAPSSGGTRKGVRMHRSVVTPGIPVRPLEEMNHSTGMDAASDPDLCDPGPLLPPEEPRGDTPTMYINEDLVDEEPMEIGYLGVSSPQTEQARRRSQGLCFYCGDKGHFISYCPVRPPRTHLIGSLFSYPVISPPCSCLSSKWGSTIGVPRSVTRIPGTTPSAAPAENPGRLQVASDGALVRPADANPLMSTADPHPGLKGEPTVGVPKPVIETRDSMPPAAPADVEPVVSPNSRPGSKGEPVVGVTNPASAIGSAGLTVAPADPPEGLVYTSNGILVRVEDLERIEEAIRRQAKGGKKKGKHR